MKIIETQKNMSGGSLDMFCWLNRNKSKKTNTTSKTAKKSKTVKKKKNKTRKKSFIQRLFD